MIQERSVSNRASSSVFQAAINIGAGGDAKEGALFYQEGDGKFDLVPVE
jgi:hypothetical protein